MKKRGMAILFAWLLSVSNPYSAMAVAVNETSQTDVIQQSSVEGETTETFREQEEQASEEIMEETVADLDETDVLEETTGFIVPKWDSLVETEKIDLSLHKENSGEFSPVYVYENPFLGRDTSNGVILEFYAKPNWEIHELGAIVAFCGSGEYEGKLYFSPGSYLGFNSDLFGGYFDANLYNYTLVTDYIKDGAKIRIELLPDGFLVYADEALCYDQTILENADAGAGDFTKESDFSLVLTWLAGAETLYFGYGSWWNTVGSNEANIDLSDVNFRLQDGTVVMDQIRVDQDLVEALGGSSSFEMQTEFGIELAEVSVELFDIDSVEYEGKTVLPIMAAAVGVVGVMAVGLIAFALKKREYEEE